MTLELLSGPIIGAVIGYFTNYIAVKMLFYPRKEIRIGGYKLPFTPGAIPKGKPRLAKAIGNIVSGTLLTEEDIKSRILSDEVEEAVVNQIMNGLSGNCYGLVSTIIPSEEKRDLLKVKLADTVTAEILESLQKMNLEETISREAKRIIMEKIQGTMMAMFLSEDMLASFIDPAGAEIVQGLLRDGESYIRAELLEKIDKLGECSFTDLCSGLEITENEIHNIIRSLYHSVVDNALNGLLKNLNITGIIEEKINAMDVKELEQMVLTVMKKELDMIVNLGALIGALIGVVNNFI